MYNQGRCWLLHAVVLGTSLVSLLLNLETTRAATFTVGDDSGWNFSVGNWTNGKNFKAGDILGMKHDKLLIT